MPCVHQILSNRQGRELRWWRQKSTSEFDLKRGLVFDGNPTFRYVALASRILSVRSADKGGDCAHTEVNL